MKKKTLDQILFEKCDVVLELEQNGTEYLLKMLKGQDKLQCDWCDETNHIKQFDSDDEPINLCIECSKQFSQKINLK